jgi:hypothetical protein
MSKKISYFQKAIETANREDLAVHQMSRLRVLFKELLASNPFYGKRLRDTGFTDARLLHSFEDLQSLPFSCKSHLIEDQEAHPPFGTNLTFPLDRYIHQHQTSGTTGRPFAGSTHARAGTGGHAVGEPFIAPPASRQRIVSFSPSRSALLSDSGRLGPVVKRSGLSASPAVPKIQFRD